MSITLPTSDFRGMTVQEFDTRTLLDHAAKQARERNYQDLFIVDTDAHHYESHAFGEIFDYLEDPVLRQLAQSAGQKNVGIGFVNTQIGFQDMGGRIPRYSVMKLEKTPEGQQRDAALTARWMDAMGVDVAVLFPSPLLLIATHPVAEIETALARAYNRWLVERVLPQEPRLRTLLYLPFQDPAACYQLVREYGDKKGVCGFMVTATHNMPVYHNDFMKLYAEIEERGLALAFHGSYNWNERFFASTNRFIAVHGLGFPLYNMLHLTNWIVNGLPERFPNLKLIWMEAGIAWLPFMMQRLDNSYMMRTSECPSLKMRPSEYIKRMYFTTQPMEVADNMEMMAATFKFINAETQLLFSSDYPHWDFNVPSVIYDLPFLSETAKRNILGGNACKVFNIENTGKLAQIPPAS